MAQLTRVLDAQPVGSLDAYVAAGGGEGLRVARERGPQTLVDSVAASGLRGRGGAGFPTGVKWRAVRENASAELPTTVVVNAAEGEPGSFKDRTLLRTNPYRVLEGALIAAIAMEAPAVVVAAKASFTKELALIRRAIGEMQRAGWLDGIEVLVVEGPGEYLFGEETALLEVIDGRAPFPRLAPPFREGVILVGPDVESAAGTVMADPNHVTGAPPSLVDNVETLANIPGIAANGADWFREAGTDASPGTIVCTVTGRTKQHGVAEFAMGTPLGEIIDTIGGGPIGSRFVAAMSGVANALVPAELFATPATYEDMTRIGSGLGAAGFIVFDDRTDLAAVGRGVSRFLAVESCGQCTPCKDDGLAMAGLLERIRLSEATNDDVAELADLTRTVSVEARCYLAHQHERVIDSLLTLFPEALLAHVNGRVGPAEEELIAPIVDIENGVAVLDLAIETKQPDWTFDATDSGQSPADRIDQRAS